MRGAAGRGLGCAQGRPGRGGRRALWVAWSLKGAGPGLRAWEAGTGRALRHRVWPGLRVGEAGTGGRRALWSVWRLKGARPGTAG